jgi:hypothetical protein
MRWLIGAAIITAALGHAFGLGAGSPAPASTRRASAAVSVTAASGAALVVGVGYNAGWRAPTLAAAGAYACFESGFRVTAVSSTGCEGAMAAGSTATGPPNNHGDRQTRLGDRVRARPEGHDRAAPRRPMTRRFAMQSFISTTTVAQLVAENRRDEAIALAYVILSERFEVLPDGGDELYTSLFTPDECQALADVLEWAKAALNG